MSELVDILTLEYDELSDFVVNELGEKAFRAKQIFDWLHVKKVATFDEMTNLSASVRTRLNEIAILHNPKIVTKQESTDGTKKYLFQMYDGSYIESVFLPYSTGDSVCISSQVGCRMACSFCASGIGGRIRDLSAGEMLSQIYAIGRNTGVRIDGVVVMGTGEPLDNYENLLHFIRNLTDERGNNLSQRSLTVSTCGLAPKIKMLADEKFSINLAISLHAPTQEKRAKIMPVANSYHLEVLMDACRYYFETTGRRITFEYSLIDGVNNTEEDAKELIRLLKPLNCHVNLIPVNPVTETGYKSPGRPAAYKFKERLEQGLSHVTVRREMGADIDGACGQLRAKANGDLK